MKMTQRLLGAALLVFLWAQSADACLFPWWWFHPPAAPGYGAYYGPSYGGSCCSSGACGVYRPVYSSAYSPCGTCNPCGCSPCGGGSCSSCGVNYSPEPEPEPAPEEAPNTNRTYAPEGDMADDVDMGMGGSVLPADDFGPTRRIDPDEPGAADGPDPFTPPTLPEEEEEAPEASDDDPAPLSPEILGDGVTINVAPVRTRVLLRAQYHVPQVARQQMEPQSPWLPVPAESQVASK